MQYKTIVALLLVVAAIGVVATAVPAAAADAGSSKTFDGPGGYQITVTKVAPTWSATPSGTFQTMSSGYTITQGQYRWHSRLINYYTTSEFFSVYWGNPSNALRLRLFTPDGYTLGPYYDSVDGVNNGAIGVTISRSSGLAQGTWYEEVYGLSVSGTQTYYI